MSSNPLFSVFQFCFHSPVTFVFLLLLVLLSRELLFVLNFCSSDLDLGLSLFLPRLPSFVFFYSASY